MSRLVPDGDERLFARELAAKIVAKPPLTKAAMKAMKRGTETGNVAYSGGDLLLFSRLMQQRARRRARNAGNRPSYLTNLRK